MTEKAIRATVDVLLSTDMEDSPMSVLSSILLSALGEADLTVLSAKFEEVLA